MTLVDRSITEQPTLVNGMCGCTIDYMHSIVSKFILVDGIV